MKIHRLTVAAFLAGAVAALPTQAMANWWGGDRWGRDDWWGRDYGPGYYRYGPGYWGGGPYGWGGGPYGWGGGPWGWGGYPGYGYGYPYAPGAGSTEKSAPKVPE